MWNLYNFKLRFLSAFIGIAPVQFVPPALPTELRRNKSKYEGRETKTVSLRMSAMTYLSGPSPDKYFRHCRA